MSRRPNVVLITSDQHRMSATGCYGNPDVVTPNLDRMARQGVRFDHCMTASPLCIPFRATLQTGLYFHQHRCGPGPGTTLGRFKGMGDYLREAGYQTCFVGKSHWHHPDEIGHVPPGQRMGWQDWFGTPPHDFYHTRLFNDDGSVREAHPGEYEPPLQTDWATGFIDRQPGAQPWCVNINYGIPHSAYGIDAYHDRPEIWARIRQINAQYGFNLPERWLGDDSRQIPQITCPQHLMFRVVPQQFLDLYDIDALTLEPDVPDEWDRLARYYYKEYYAMVTALDREVGRVMDYLTESGRIENTIVIYTSDHGDLLCSRGALRGKAMPFRNSLRTPLLAWGPAAGVAPGQLADALVNSVDLLPTVLELAGIEKPGGLPGRGMASWLAGGQGPKPEAIFMELFHWRAIYDGQYVYAVTVQNDPPGYKPYILSDLVNDPYEQTDLVAAPDHAAAREALHRKLTAFLVEQPQRISRAGLV